MTELVVRTDTGHICANGKWYTLSTLGDKVFDIVTASGSNNPAFDMPPWFYTGSPYADEIESLGCAEVIPPTQYQKEYVPALGDVWRSREPAWPSIFNCKVKPNTGSQIKEVLANELCNAVIH